MQYKKEDDISLVIPDHRKVIYMADPVRFVEEIIFNHSAKKFGGDRIVTEHQKEMLMAIAQNRRVSVRAGRGLGKSATLAWLIIWWLAMFEGGQVAAFAPSFGQLNSVLWPEVAKWLKGSLVSEFFVHTATKLYLKSDPKNTFAEPRTASKEEAAQGLHADHLLILMDEAPGIEDKIWNVLQGSLTDKNNKALAMGNPARTSGFFYDAFHKDKRTWTNLKFSSEDSPNVDESWLSEMKLKYVNSGIIHDIYKVHVLGEFPSGDATAFIPLEDVYNATNRIVTPGFPIEIGVDVARFGDDLTCIAVREGDFYHDPIVMNKSSIDMTVERVLRTVDELRNNTGYSDIIRVKVDDTGVGGGCTDYLNLDREHNIAVVPCNFGGAGDGTYSNEASKMWGDFKNNIGNVQLPKSQFLQDELSTRKWELDSRGKTKIQPKGLFKKDFGASPDHADAYILAGADKVNELLHIKSFDYVKDNKQWSADMLQSGDRYASIFLSNSGLMSAVFATFVGGHLRVIDEYIGDTSDIIRMIHHYSPLVKVIGSANMFNTKGDDIFLQYTQSGLFLQESYGYDQHGATRHLERLASMNSFVVASECTESATQLRTWTIGNDTGRKKDDYGLCLALLHIVSELYLQNSIIHTDELMDQYSPTTPIEIDFLSLNDNFMSV